MVNLPNGNSIDASICGNVKVSNDLIIRDVLYLPKFEVNLIPISKVCKEQDCNMVFETDKCVIQERKDLRNIGLAKELYALYHLEAQREHNVSLVSSIFANKKADQSIS